MNSTDRRESSRKIHVAPAELRLADWPLRDDGWRAWVGVMAVAAIALGLGSAFQSGLVGAASGVALAVAGWRLFVPVVWEFGTQGVTARMLGLRRFVPWQAVNGWKVYHRGVVLLPESNAAPWMALRGWYVPWRGERDRLVGVLEYYVGAGQSGHPTN